MPQELQREAVGGVEGEADHRPSGRECCSAIIQDQKTVRFVLYMGDGGIWNGRVAMKIWGNYTRGINILSI